MHFRVASTPHSTFQCDVRPQCTATNPVLTVEVTGLPLISAAKDGDEPISSVSGDVTTITFDLSERTDYNYSGTWYEWRFVISLRDACNLHYTWSDDFIQMSYVDDEQNSLNMFGVERLSIIGPDTGYCRECKTAAL